jgi:hypothetical protein
VNAFLPAKSYPTLAWTATAAELTCGLGLINSWNRLGVAFLPEMPPMEVPA